ELVLQHGTESYKVLDELARHKVPVSMTIVDSPGGKAEVVDFIEQCGFEMNKAGIKVLVNTDDPITESRFFLRTAAIAVRGGLAEDVALKAITLHGAEVMHLADRVGSLAPGKDADFVVLSGPPFSIYTRVLWTYIDGQKVFDLADEKERLYQTGGFAVGEGHKVPAEKAPEKPRPAAKAPEIPAGSPAPAPDAKELVVLAGWLHTVSGGTMENGAVHVKDGKIVYAGPRKDFQIPAGVPVVAAANVTPGLIDAYTCVPLTGQYNVPADQDQDEMSDPNQAETRVLDAFNPGEALLQFLLRQGITVVHACPGRANAIAGTTGVFRTHGKNVDKMTVRFPQAMLFNLGVAPKTTYPGRKPGTRMGTAALIRTALTEAVNDSRQRKNAKDPASAPDRNLKHEALGLALDKKVQAMFTAHRADDVLTALRLSDEFKLQCVLAATTEGYLVSDEIAKAGVPVIVHPTMQRSGGLETFNSFLGNAAALSDAKILTAISTGHEDYVPKTRVVRHEAGMAVPYGLGFEGALRAVTLDAAKILQIDDRFGSLEAGKTADLVLYDGDPFEHATHVQGVIVDGRVVYDASKNPPAPLAQRFFFANPEIPCCLGW
ncbi:MAG: amidohydrolase family protein, partial [Planctomycetia bacterium]|nr:amidohydrolase family protein [Planctomycetia bacterium]